MRNKQREQEILSILRTKNDFVSVKQLAEALFASESSIRRDLKAMEQQGMIKRSYGGAALQTSTSRIITFNHRTQQNIAAKREIAAKAAALIPDGSIVFLDQSSTCFYLANEIIDRSDLTVVTNNTEIMILLSNSKMKVISSGGYLSDENRNCLIGGDAQRTFADINADILFFSVKAISWDGTVTDSAREEVIIRNTMLRNAGKKILLCDSTKFGHSASYKQCELKDVDCLISEGSQAQDFSDYKGRLDLL